MCYERNCVLSSEYSYTGVIVCAVIPLSPAYHISVIARLTEGLRAVEPRRRTRDAFLLRSVTRSFPVVPPPVVLPPLLSL